VLWKKAIQDMQVNARFSAAAQSAVLLQLLLLALLCLALARPVMNLTKAPQAHVILIDRSAPWAIDHSDRKNYPSRRGPKTAWRCRSMAARTPPRSRLRRVGEIMCTMTSDVRNCDRRLK